MPAAAEAAAGFGAVFSLDLPRPAGCVVDTHVIRSKNDKKRTRRQEGTSELI